MGRAGSGSREQMTRRKVETCVFSERRLSVEGVATDHRTVQRRMNRSFGVLACCLDRGGFLSEASLSNLM